MRNDSKTSSSTGRPPLHRRQYIVDPPFQYRLIGTLMSLWLANSLFFTVLLYFFYEGHVRKFYELVPRPGMMPLLSLPTLFALSIGFVFVFGFVVLGLLAIYMSNQIAGPLHRTKSCLDRVGRGDWNFSLQFRQGDFLRDIPAVFNAMLEALRQQIESDVEELRGIEETAEDEAELRQLVRRLRERKEAQLGLGGNGASGRSEPEPVSLAIH